jgi:alkylation response protein AidB-like acyl-CoA dehydrogenase
LDLELEDDQLELREAAIGVLDRHAPLTLARSYLNGDGDASELWEQIAALGWFGVGLDEDDPFGVPGLCLLAEQVGRRAAPTTLVDTAAVVRVATVASGAWADRIVAGDPPVALATLEPGCSWSAAPSATTARRNADHVIVSGEKLGVHHAASVGLLAVVVDLDGAAAVALIEPERPGVEILPLEALDPSCAARRIELEEVRVAHSELLAGPAIEAALGHALDVAAVATTAEGLGAASAALEMAVAYALEREQYGRKIGGFQALRHHIAEQHVLRETAWASVLYAAAALQERTDDAGSAVAVAKAHGAAATKAVVEGALQVFGGIGFTREHDFHLLYRRALECAGRFGGALEHERRVADALLSGEPALAGH